MTELEKYQKERRSGLYETTTVPEDIGIKTPPADPAIPKPVPRPAPVTTQPGAPTEESDINWLIAFRVAWEEMKATRNEHKSLKTLINWLIAAIVIAMLAIGGLGYWAYTSTGKTKVGYVEKAGKTRVVYKTKVKKVYITGAGSKWRKKMCNVYGDWPACKAYKKNLPLRARVGRVDL